MSDDHLKKYIIHMEHVPENRVYSASDKCWVIQGQGWYYLDETGDVNGIYANEIEAMDGLKSYIASMYGD